VSKPAKRARRRLERSLAVAGKREAPADLARERFERVAGASAPCQNKLVDHTAMGKKKKVDPSRLVTIPFDDLVLAHSEIGVHRGRKYGFRDVFGFRTLRDLPFTKLAKKVKAAYTGEDVPKHKGWPDQREALRWLVDKGADAMYAFKDDIRVTPGPSKTYYIVGGNHRSLALYILGADGVRAQVVDDY